MNRLKTTELKAVRIAMLASAMIVPSVCAAAPAQQEPAQESVAEDSDSQLDAAEIIVTAQKYDERLKDVPIPVTVVDTGQLSEVGQVKLQDFYATVPGLNLVAGGAGRPQLSIRGLTTAGTSSPTVGIIVDDVPYGYTVAPNAFASAPDIDPGDVAQIEVLRGPQGTLYGASSMGGLLKYVLRAPSTDSVSGYVASGIEAVANSSDVGFTLRGALNTPISDQLAVRASGFRISLPGFIDNVLTGKKDSNNTESSGGRLSALWLPSDRLSVQLSAVVQQLDRRDSEYASLDVPGLGHRSAPGTEYYRRTSKVFSANIRADLGSFEVRSISAYSDDKMDYSYDYSEPLGFFAEPYGVDGLSGPEIQRTRKVSQELRAAIPVTEGIDWLIGGFYTHEKFTDDWNLFAIDRASGDVAANLLEIHTKNLYEEYAAFTNATFAISDSFDIQLGGRIFSNKITTSNDTFGPLVFISPSFPANSGTDSSYTYSLVARYRVTPDAMFYGRISSGYRPGGPNVVCDGVVTPCKYDPDKTVNYEAGFKGDFFDGVLFLDASAYYIDWSDIQLSFSFANPSITVKTNAGKAVSKGVELAMTLKPWEGMEISGWFAYNSAKLKEALPPPPVANGQPAGSRLPGSSPYSGHISARQSFALSEDWTGSLGVSATFVDDRLNYLAFNQTIPILPGYNKVDLSAGLSRGSLDITAYVNNVGNTRGILAGGAGIDANNVYYIRPRSIGVSVMKRF